MTVTFVDDLCAVLSASSPAALDAAVQVLLGILTSTFHDLHLTVNWGPGKTESLLHYRGIGARAAREAWRRDDGSLSIPVPNSSVMLRIVPEYAHLGSFIRATSESWKLVSHHVSAALTAYAPIAKKVFGSALIPVAYRIMFCHSLIMSRLTFNLHIAILGPRLLKRAASVYHRVLRQICYEQRVSADEIISNSAVRHKLGVVSIDALLMHSRLRYFGRVVLYAPPDSRACLYTVAHG